MYFHTTILVLAFLGATSAAPVDVEAHKTAPTERDLVGQPDTIQHLRHRDPHSIEPRQGGKDVRAAVINGIIDWGKSELEEAVGEAMFPDKGIPELEADPSSGELNDMNFKSWNPSVHGDK